MDYGPDHPSGGAVADAGIFLTYCYGRSSRCHPMVRQREAWQQLRPHCTFPKTNKRLPNGCFVPRIQRIWERQCWTNLSHCNVNSPKPMEQARFCFHKQFFRESRKDTKLACRSWLTSALSPHVAPTSDPSDRLTSWSTLRMTAHAACRRCRCRPRGRRGGPRGGSAGAT